MMKKTIISGCLFLIGTTAINAQVGIKTDAPTNTLDVNGTARVRTLLPNTFDSSVDKIVVTDANGVLKSVPSSAISAPKSYDVLFDTNVLSTNGTNPTTITDIDPLATTPRTALLINEQTIDLPKDALVQINFSVPIIQVYGLDANKASTNDSPVDGKTKMLRTHLLIDGSVVTKATNIYSNSKPGLGTGSDAAPLTGTFFNTGSYFIKLTAGKHKIRLEGTCNPYVQCKQGGNTEGARFQAVALY